MKARYPFRRYLNVQMSYAPAFRSDGQRLAFLSNITGLPQVWEVALTERNAAVAWPDQITFDSDRIQMVKYSPAHGDRRLIYVRDAGGNENAQFFLLDTEGAQEVALTAGHDDVMHGFEDWSQDGRAILFSANRRDRGLFDLYLQPLDGEPRLIWRNERPGFLYNARFSPDGKRAIVGHMASSFSMSVYEIDLESGAGREISPMGANTRYSDMAYADDGKALYLCTDYEANFLYLARLDLDNGAIERLVAPEWDVEGCALSPDKRTLIYGVNVDGVTEIFARNLESGDTRRASALEGLAGTTMAYRGIDVAFSPDSTQAAFSYSSATRTFDIFVWDLASGDAQPVTRSSHGGLPEDSFVAPELVHYPTFDQDETGNSRQIPAWLYRQSEISTGPMPVVVIVHGGPEGQSRPLFNFLIQYLVHNGYAVFVPNVRGSVGYGNVYSHLDDVEKRMDSVADLAHAAYWLKEQAGIDGDRIVVYGGSYGGFMVLSAVTTYPDLWAAGVDIVGISNFVTFLENTSDYRRSHREQEYGSLERDRDFLDRISPNNHVDKIVAPLIVIHGANDPRVPVGEAEQMVAALRERGVRTEFLVFDDEGHGIIKLKNKLVAYPAIVKFLDSALEL